MEDPNPRLVNRRRLQCLLHHVRPFASLLLKHAVQSLLIVSRGVPVCGVLLWKSLLCSNDYLRPVPSLGNEQKSVQLTHDDRR